jgi:hypothetical protein
MRINNNQQNVSFEQNVVVHFVTRDLGDRDVAKAFAVAQKKIDSTTNVGVAVFVTNNRILVTDKTVEISKRLRDAYYKFMDIGERINRRIKKYGENLDQNKIKPIREKQEQAIREYEELRDEIAKEAETIDYIA